MAAVGFWGQVGFHLLALHKGTLCHARVAVAFRTNTITVRQFWGWCHNCRYGYGWLTRLRVRLTICCLREYVSNMLCRLAMWFLTLEPHFSFKTSCVSKLRISPNDSTMVSAASRRVAINRISNPLRGLLDVYVLFHKRICLTITFMSSAPKSPYHKILQFLFCWQRNFANTILWKTQ